jgi:vancomycin resistance protein YoaR
VIKGDRTEPDYGGGLCQVSTTAYRGIWEYGFPIESRRNHSYAVSYYGPQGTDATIYPGVQDMQFTNNSPGDLLIQTYIEGLNAYFIYYGTHDERTSEIVGPYIWGQTSAPPQRIEYTTDLAPGAKRKLGNPVGGMKTMWYRVLNDGTTIEDYYSQYQARPLFMQIGAAKEEPVSTDTANPSDPLAVPVPSWLQAE